MKKKLIEFIFNFLGICATILGCIGIILPLLPTTPFLLLASLCFMRGSPRFRDWLHQHQHFGPIINNWQNNRAISSVVKKRARWFIVVSFMLSIYLVSLLWLKFVLLFFGIGLLLWFNRLPVIDNIAHCQKNH
ncbi:YbaN family protein [Vibrio sp. SS-MA-C1-2]|uniref:YbaN family protein n=1 Tax=Vibrio sp. SS-MA-C1-2 TaxID=2908646 RepID=UPI001F245028|nr:YbaN family protein [Vibrio sp. SS-MA-C1-2]UJF20178.1 YbaN family protein [Vibrio sp. SS-MA-C1-2]